MEYPHYFDYTNTTMPFRITYNIRNHPLRQEFLEELSGMLALLMSVEQDHVLTIYVGRRLCMFSIPDIRTFPHYTEWENIRLGQRICNLFWNRFADASTCQELNRAKVATMKCLYYRDVCRHYAVPI